MSPFWALRVDFGHLEIILDPWEAILGVNFEPIRVDLGLLGVDFRFLGINLGFRTSMLDICFGSLRFDFGHWESILSL